MPQQWLDVYGAHLTRDAGDSNSQHTAFRGNNYRITVDMRLPFQPMMLEAVANIEDSQTNIDDGNQKRISNSTMLGLVAPQPTQVG